MIRSPHVTAIRCRATCLLFLGLLAVTMHVLAGTGLMRSSAGASFAAEVCSSHGAFRNEAIQVSGTGSLPATGSHDCCKTCAAAAPLLAAGIEIGASLVLLTTSLHDSSSDARPTLAVRTAHPPRGPPARG